MSLVQGIVDWTEKVFVPLGPWGLFLLAFMESSFFPIPPDVLLIVLTLAEPSYWFWFAAICTLGSVLGGMFGYWLGFRFGKPFLQKFVSEKKIAKVHRLFEKYEAGAIFFAGFSPLPYKVFTIAGGMLYIDFKKFVLASLVSRGLRFFALAGFLYLYGEAIVSVLEEHFAWATLGIAVFLVLGYYGYRKLKKKGMF